MHRLLAILIAIMVGNAHAKQAPGVKGPKTQFRTVLRLVEHGRYKAAVKAADSVLERHPGAVAVRGLKGIALARLGRYSDALRFLESSQGTQVYLEAGGVSAHADALRAAGQGRAAWRIRSAHLSPTDPQNARVKSRCHGIDDLLSVGDALEARGLGELAVLEAPESATAHAFLASALLAMGDVDGAQFHQWLAKQYSVKRVPRIAINEARIAAVYGDDLMARRAWSRARVMRKKDPRILAWQSEWLRSKGEHQFAIAGLTKEWVANVQHPDVLSERIRVYRSLEQHKKADLEYRRLVRLFPEHPNAAELDELIE